MIVLGVDASSPVATVGVARGTRILTEAKYPPRRDPSEPLLGYIDDVLEVAGVALAEVGGVALVAGPGSLTGLRVAWAAVCGLAQPTRLPIAAVAVADAQRRALEDEGVAAPEDAVCLVHHRGELYYWLSLNAENAGKAYRSASIRDFLAEHGQPSHIVGPGLLRARAELESAGAVSVAPAGDEIVGGGTIAVMGAERIAAGDVVSVDECPLDYGLPPEFRKQQPR